ncbi:hypothetical protein ACEN2S_20625 [Phaeovulum sp. W22_SRMD_FR3]
MTQTRHDSARRVCVTSPSPKNGLQAIHQTSKKRLGRTARIIPQGTAPSMGHPRGACMQLHFADVRH